ncbi:hypothetical protein [Rufibacter tibetensis]|uniref:Uncharacterized protein n=1 Tax=Rufibacter tibetensis TaxID=512763 RepID=A0A0P0CA04_9BACT|nr:hypothetical protein [Rufibacter tibetensis]ALI98311.1 hypothetical protein DC20_04075 [Rufibacter tibetensis]
MKFEDFEKREIIFESIWKTIALTITSGLFVFSAIAFVDRKESPFSFWTTLLLFGFGVINGLYLLFNPKTLFIRPASKLAKEYGEVDYQKRYNNLGVFDYLDNGFVVTIEEEDLALSWSELNTIVAYKQDLYTYDVICLDVFTIHGQSFNINEDTPGWFQFLERLNKTFPSIDKGWQKEVSIQSFETKLTLLYDRQNRDLERVIEEYYKK